MASAVEELEDSLDVQDEEAVRALSESTYEGTCDHQRNPCKVEGKTMNRVHQLSSSTSFHKTFGSRVSSSNGAGWGKKQYEAKRSVRKPEEIISDIGLGTPFAQLRTGTDMKLRYLLQSNRCGACCG